MYKIRLYTEWLPNSSNEGKTKFFVAEVIKISDLAFVVRKSLKNVGIA